MVHDNHLQLTRNSPGPAPARCPGSPCHCWEEGMAATGSRTPCGKKMYKCEGQKEKNIHMADFTFGCLNQIEHHSVTNTCKLCINKSKMYIPPPCQPQPHRWSQSLGTDLTWLCEWRPAGQGGRTRGGRSDNLSWRRKRWTRDTKWRREVIYEHKLDLRWCGPVSDVKNIDWRMVSVVGDHIDIVSPDKDKQMQKIIIILMTKVSFMMIKCSNCKDQEFL